MSHPNSQTGSFERILGIPFFTGTASAAIDRLRSGGLLVVPAAPALKDLDRNPGYREALLNADLVIPDSAFMVMIWNRMGSRRLRRLSGLEYLVALLHEESVRQPGNAFWIMAGPESARSNLTWLSSQGVAVGDHMSYLAPHYGSEINDPDLLERMHALRPAHVIVTIGGGNQERLGLYLKRNLDYLPAIHCIGAAIAFLSGDQVRIPMWADRAYLGWLFRSFSQPTRFFPRYWEARKLLSLMRRHGSELPPLLS